MSAPEMQEHVKCSASNLTPVSLQNPLPSHIPTPSPTSSSFYRLLSCISAQSSPSVLMPPYPMPIPNSIDIPPTPEPLSIRLSIPSPLPIPPQPPHPRLLTVRCCQEPFGSDERCPTEQPGLLEESRLPGLGMRRALITLDDPGLSRYMPWRG